MSVTINPPSKAQMVIARALARRTVVEELRRAKITICSVSTQDINTKVRALLDKDLATYIKKADAIIALQT